MLLAGTSADPPSRAAHWEWIAAMFGEARLAISPLQLPAKGFFKRQRTPAIHPVDVFGMLRMADWSTQLLPKYRDQYPEEVLGVVLSIISSPTVIDILDPD